MQFLNDLNPYQKEAVTTTEGPLLVLAGAGSGKTKVITYRLIYLLKKLHIPAKRILAVTFTNKAANEMRERIKALTGNIKDLSISTFHAFGVHFLKEEIKVLGYMPKFSIYSDKDTLELLHSILIDLKLDAEKYPPRLMAYLISKAKNKLLFPEQAGLEDPVFRDIYRLYQEQLRVLNAVDFDDLIFLPVKILQSHSEIQQKWSQRFQYIMVDEYQDTNHSQYILIRLLSQFHNNICVVGDDDQSIYAFRGADFHNILSFEKHFKKDDPVKIITLKINYRSTPIILEAAYALISHNSKRHAKSVETFLKDGEKINLFETMEAREEAEIIADEIFNGRIEGKVPYHDHAVLCRTNTQMRTFEEVFRQKNIPYRLIGGFSFFDRKEVKDLIAYLKLIYNPLDNLSFLRIVNFPKRGIGDTTLEKFKNFAFAHDLSFLGAVDSLAHKTDSDLSKPLIHKFELFKELIEKYEKRFQESKVSEVLVEFFQEIELEKEFERIYKDEAPFRIKVIGDFIDYAKNYESYAKKNDELANLEGFLKNMSLLNQDTKDDDEETNHKVPIMTIHASKGL
ncbi:MAG TPA: ATP-dependent DNA helicase Rep, partial [Spirochaetia bacterium]|nr:ATP-dependent DNA helicase Rep [Spirochaetia bacterium]